MITLMKTLNILAIIFLAFMMLYGAYNHVANPAFYNGFIPDFMPKIIVNYFSAVMELFIGVLILVPKWRRFGAFSFIALMLAFFPIHIWDLLKDIPAIGSKQAGVIRLVVQFIFIGIGYFVFKRASLSRAKD
jgi:uncharacterized membrane protein